MNRYLDNENVEMIYEANRLKSFKNWPFKKEKCSAKLMAQAGFFHTPSRSQPDAVKCFACLKELEGWEPDDDPWREHRDHSGNCVFVKLNKKESDLSLHEMLDVLKYRQMKIYSVKSREVSDRYKKEAQSSRLTMSKIKIA